MAIKTALGVFLIILTTLMLVHVKLLLASGIVDSRQTMRVIVSQVD